MVRELKDPVALVLFRVLARWKGRLSGHLVGVTVPFPVGNGGYERRSCEGNEENEEEHFTRKCRKKL